MKKQLFRLILLTSLSFSNLILSMESDEKELSEEFSLQEAKEQIIAIVDKNKDIFDTVDQVLEFLKKSNLLELRTKKIEVSELIQVLQIALHLKFINAGFLHSKNQSRDEKQSELDKKLGLALDNEDVVQCAKYVIAGANPNLIHWAHFEESSKTLTLSTILTSIISSPKLSKLANILLLYGADVNGETRCFNASTLILNSLLQEVLPQNPKISYHRPIIEAYLFARSELATQLLDYGPNTHATDKYGKTLADWISLN